MSYLIGAIFCCLFSVRALTQGKKIWIEMKGPVTRIVALLYAFVGTLSIWFAYQCVNEFLAQMGWL